MKLKDALEMIKDGEFLERYDKVEEKWIVVPDWFLSIVKHRKFRIQTSEMGLKDLLEILEGDNILESFYENTWNPVASYVTHAIRYDEFRIKRPFNYELETDIGGELDKIGENK